jgi:Bax inhibitor 1
MTNGCFFSLSILVTAFVGTAIAFACFTGAAMVARRREYLYLGGLLSSGLSILLWLQLAGSIFGHSATSFMFEVPACLYPLLIYNPMEQQCIHCLSVCEMHAHSSLGLNTCLLLLQVYFGLLIFLGYVVYDTQEIIERAHRGDMDHVKHALTLFTDFVAVLVRVLVIMVSELFPLGDDAGLLPRIILVE